MAINAASPVIEIYEHLLKVISSDGFIKMQGLGNEIPFFICPFDPEKSEAILKDVVGPLINKLGSKGIHVLKIDLYDISVRILKDRGIWGRIFQIEQEISKPELKELLQSVLDVENHIIPAMKDAMDEGEFDVLFITGVGEVFPYIRSHTILNNLQSAAKEKPTLMFFPGEYRQSDEKGSSLNLFGRLLDDNYYRAFNIFNHS